MPRRDLSLDEQANVRAALRVLRAKLDGQWTNVSRALPLSYSSLWEVTSGRAAVSPMVALRVAKALDAPLGDVLTGAAIPPGTCKHCGMPTDG